jgi:DNA polymerase-3 subunit gamma/tau
MSIAERYRPQTFEEIIGQPHAVEIISRLTRRADPRPLLITGAYGVGKTTFARVYARALNCASPQPSGSPCLRCEPCLYFGTSDEAWVYTEVPAGVTGDKNDAKYVHELAHLVPLLDVPFRVILIDEAHMLTVPAQDTLLATFETPNIAVFVLATTEPSRITGPLRSRCQRVHLRPLSNAELIQHGMLICGIEGIEPEPGALALLASDADGHMRNFLLAIDQFAHNGALRTAEIANGLDLAWANIVLRALIAVAHGDDREAANILREWAAPPEAKADAMRDALVHVAHVAFAPAGKSPEATAAFLLASPQLMGDLIWALRLSTGGFGVRSVEYVWGLAQQWSRSAPLLRNQGDLELELLRSAHAISPSDPRLDELPVEFRAPSASTHMRRGRPPTDHNDTMTGRYRRRPEFLTRADVLGEYRAATMLAQEFGLWFNVRFCMPFADYGIDEPFAAMKFLSDLKRELRLRLRDWTGDPEALLHFLQQNEVDDAGHITSWLLMCIPHAHVIDTHEWIVTQLPLRDGELTPSAEPGMWRAPTHGRQPATHWMLVRELWRSMDPAIPARDGSKRVRLKDMLAVPCQGPRVAGVLPPRVRRWSSSEALSTAAWDEAFNAKFGYVCAIENEWWEALDRGWEFDERKHRQDEAKRRAEAIASIEAQFPHGRDAATDLTREQKLRAFFDRLPFDPLRRQRKQPPL